MVFDKIRRFMERRKILLIIILLICVLLACILSIYGQPPAKTSCDDIPPNSVVFAPAFLHLGVKNKVIVPGKAAEQIAEQLEECADRFSVVLTQKAISNALYNPKALNDGTPVFQMHRHDPDIEVCTLAGFR